MSVTAISTERRALRKARRRELGARIRILRQQAGLTQEALAARAGCDRQTISHAELANHAVSLDRFLEIVDALGIEPQALFASQPAHSLAARPSGRTLTA